MNQILIIYSTGLMTPLKNSIGYILQTLVRAKTNLKYKIVKWRRRLPKNIMTDAEVKYLSEKKYPESFRLVHITMKKMTF